MKTYGFPKRKFWGLEIEEINSGDGYKFWRIFNLKKPFYHNGFYWAGINVKLLDSALREGVSRIYVWWEDFEDDVGIELPRLRKSFAKWLKQKEKDGEFEMIPSKFEGAEAMKIYWFRIGKYKGSEGIKPKTKREMNKEAKELNKGDELPIGEVDVKDLYEVRDKREKDGVMWCWVKWRGWFKDKEAYKGMMFEVMSELEEGAVFSYEQKRLYVREQLLGVLEGIIVKYAGEFRSADEDTAKKLDDIFGRKREEVKTEIKKE
jgi:hypothetical protein